MEPDDKNPPKSESEEVYVSLHPEANKLSDLVLATETGYHRGYMEGLRHAALIVFACVFLAVTLESVLDRRF